MLTELAKSLATTGYLPPFMVHDTASLLILGISAIQVAFLSLYDPRALFKKIGLYKRLGGYYT